MRSLFLLVPVLFLLNGCLTGNMERITSDTRDTVRASNVLITETKDGQQLGLAIELMTDTAKPMNMRVAACETVFTKAPEDRVGKYIGAPGHIRLRTHATTLDRVAREIKNVAIIGDALDEEMVIAPVNDELFRVQSFAALRTLEQLLQKSKMPGLTADDMTTLRANTVRMIYVATTILGGTTIEKVRLNIRGQARHFEVTAERRTRAAAVIAELSRTLSLPEDQIAEAKANIESRMGVPSF